MTNERREITLVVGYDGRLKWPDNSPILKHESATLFREVLPDDKTEAEIREDTIKRVCEFLRSHKASGLASKAWADLIEANAEEILK